RGRASIVSALALAAAGGWRMAGRRVQFDYPDAGIAGKRKRDTLAGDPDALPFGSRLNRGFPMFDLSAVQAAVREASFDGWLLYDFRGQTILAQRVAAVSPKLSRRWFYYVPASGEPKKLVHAIEPGSLDHLPGKNKTVYRRWQELETGVGALVTGAKRVAMEYSPRNANPYIGRVDAGTVELVKSYGCDVAASGDLIQLFEATWDDDQEKSHFEAAKLCRQAYDVAFQFIASEIKAKGKVLETAVQARIMKHFTDSGVTTYSPPNVGGGPHSGDPPLDPAPATDMPIQRGSFVLIDPWAELDRA